MEDSFLDSFLFDLIFHYSADYYEKLQQEETFNIDRITNKRAELEKVLTPEQFKLAESYKHSCALREETLNIQLNIKLINEAVKMGMCIQKFLDKDLYE